MQLTRPLLAVTSAVMALTLMAGCSSSRPVTKPSKPAAALTEAQYLDSLTEYKDVAALSLPASATPDQFGGWAIGLEGKGQFADCDRPKAVVQAAIALGISDWSADWYPKVAKTNVDNLTAAGWGTNWAANKAAVTWHDANVAADAQNIAICVKNEHTGTFVKYQFVSATQSGSTYTVIWNAVPGPQSTEPAGQHVSTYQTAVENGDIIITSFTAH